MARPQHTPNSWAVLRAGLAAALCAALAGAAAAAPALSDEALAGVSARGLVNLGNRSEGGLDFTRIAFGAELQLSANLNQVRLGQYSLAGRNASGADIDIAALSFGRSDLGEAYRTVSLTDPYVEVVYRHAQDPARRELLGARFGFATVRGDLGVQLAVVSGALRIDAGSAGLLSSANDPLGGRRWDGSPCGSASCTALAALGSLRAGDANGPSRDFWLSVLKEPVQFPATAGLVSAPAQAGFWMNWTDRLAGQLGAMPANLPRP